MNEQRYVNGPGRILRNTIALTAVTGAIVGGLIGCATVFLNTMLHPRSILVVLGWSMLYYVVIALVIGVITVLLILLVPHHCTSLQGFAAWIASAFFILVISLPFSIGVMEARGLLKNSIPKLLVVVSIISIVLMMIGLIKRWWSRRHARWYLRPHVVLIGCVVILPLLTTFFVYLSGRLSGTSHTAQLSPTIEKPTPVMIIGFDAAGWDVLYPLRKMGMVPAFNHLIGRGSSGYLDTLDEGKSLLIWTTVATGKFPRGHGILDWLHHSLPGCPEPIYHGPRHTGFDRLLSLLERFSLSTSSVPDARDRRSPALWNIADAAGLTSCVINWWATWPVEIVNGTMISNYFFPLEETSLRQVQDGGRDSRQCTIHPETIEEKNREIWRTQQKWADDNFERYVGFSIRDMTMSMSNPVPLTSSWVLAIDAATAAVANEMLSEKTFDVMMVYFRGLDIVEHFFWKYMYPEPFDHISAVEQELFNSIIPSWYMFYDRFLADSLNRFSDERNVIILSDHAMLPETKPNFFNKSGQHATGPAGIFCAVGPAFHAGKRLYEVGVEDIYPTVLNLLDLPHDSTTDGSVLFESLRELRPSNPEGLKATVDYRYLLGKRRFCTFDREKQQDDDVRLMLRKLGYIE